MIKAPYNFVNLNHDIFIPQWEGQISQDVPFSDGEDGLIEVELTNRTPLFIKNGVGASATGKKEEYSSHILLPDGSKRYFLPGSSIKGMLRSVLEILSFGRLHADDYNDELFGYRDFSKNSPLRKPYAEAMAKVGYGWLHCDKDTDRYLLDDCGDFNKDQCTIAISELENILPRYKDVRGANAFEKADVLGYPKVKGKTLVCSGYMKSKLLEYLFGDVLEWNQPVDEEVVNRMKTVYKPSPKDYYDTLCSKLRNGERIPVFFRRCADGIVEMGLTRMFRHAYKYRMSDFVKQEEKSGYDLAQCIFGYTEKSSSLKGRVSIGNAFCAETVQDGKLISLKGVLGQPRASYHPLYLKQANRVGGKYFTYNDSAAEMAGRKRYRIHADHVLTDIPPGNGKANNVTEMKMLPAGLHFRFSMSLHNMRPEEVGALLSALTFHGTKNVYHNIGMAKSFGYGKLEVKRVTLHGFSQEVNDYMRSFELCMSEFTKASSRPMLWTATPQVQWLLAIASEHSDKDELTMMPLNANSKDKDSVSYEEGKENGAYSELKENPFSPQSLVAVGLENKVNGLKAFYDCNTAECIDAVSLLAGIVEEYKRLQTLGYVFQNRIDKLQNLKACYDEVIRLEEKKSGMKALGDCDTAECTEAVKLLAEVMNGYEKLQGQSRVFQSRIDELQKLKTAYNDAVLHASSSNISTAAAESFEKQVQKVSSIGQLKGALQKWLNGKDRNALTKEECQWLHDRLQDYWQDKAFKKERKKWQDSGKGAWKDLAAFIHSDELLTKWHEECVTLL